MESQVEDAEQGRGNTDPEQMVSKAESRVEGHQQKENSPIATISVAIFILLALGAVAFLYYQNQQLKNMLANYQSQPANSPTPTATADPTANWKTYTDPSNRFGVKYPSDWVRSKNATNKNKYTQVVDLAKTLDSTFYGPDQVHALWIKLVDNPTNQSLEQIIKSGTLDKNYGTLSTIYNTGANIPPKFTTSTVNGYQIYQPDDNWPSAFGIKTAFIKNPINNSYAWINIEPYDSGKQELTNIFDQILSTFKFINPTASPSGIPVACPQLAKQCPDGSYVSPTGPNCEFAPCPTP
jgi:hypothetical protein